MIIKTTLITLLLLATGFNPTITPVPVEPAEPSHLLDPTDRVQESIKILHDIKSMDDEKSLPTSMIEKSEGIVILPEIVKAGFVIGGKHGKGIALIKGVDGEWSNPLFVKMTGGSIGWQIGVQKIELILVFRDRDTVRSIANGEFEIGADASATAGPVGRSTSASTNAKLEAEIYSYSKSKGLFVGISLDGSTMKMDDKRNDKFYDSDDVSASQIFSNKVNGPAGLLSELKSALQKLK